MSAFTSNQLSGYNYDAAGNMTHDAATNTNYSFDQENRITGANGYTYTYDADGNRVEKSNGSTGTIYWYMSSGIVAESDLAGALKSEYVFFDGQRIARRDFSGNAVFYYFSDNRGTASVIADSSGTTKAESDYYPWGGEFQFVNNDSNHYKFIGKERDNETQLDYFGARHYGNWIGRFVTPDEPFADQHTAYPQSWNLYVYAHNNPASNMDRDGRSCVKTDNGTSGDNGDGQGCEEAGIAPSANPDETPEWGDPAQFTRPQVVEVDAKTAPLFVVTDPTDFFNAYSRQLRVNFTNELTRPPTSEEYIQAIHDSFNAFPNVCSLTFAAMVGPDSKTENGSMRVGVEYNTIRGFSPRGRAQASIGPFTGRYTANKNGRSTSVRIGGTVGLTAGLAPPHNLTSVGVSVRLGKYASVGASLQLAQYYECGGSQSASGNAD